MRARDRVATVHDGFRLAEDLNMPEVAEASQPELQHRMLNRRAVLDAIDQNADYVEFLASGISWH